MFLPDIQTSHSTVRRPVSPEELVDIQQEFLGRTTRMYLRLIHAATLNLSITPSNPFAKYKAEISDATTKASKQVDIIQDTIIGYLLCPQILIPTIKYGNNETTLYLEQGEPTHAQRIIHKNLPPHYFATTITNTYEQTVIQELTAIRGFAQFLRRDPFSARIALSIQDLSNLSSQQLNYLINHSKNALQGNDMPLENYFGQLRMNPALK